MVKKKPESIDLVEKEFDSKLKTTFKGDIYNLYIFIELYINKHYGKLLHYLPFIVIYLNVYEKGPYLFEVDVHKFNIIDLNTDSKYNQKTDKKAFEKYYKLFRNTDKRFTYFPVVQKTKFDGSHAVFFIYDKLLNQIEFFDPNADDFYNYRNFFNKFFAQIYGKKIKIVYPDNTCPFFGSLELKKCKKMKYLVKSGGFCAAWNLWYLELRLKNENLSRDEVISKSLSLLKKGNQRVCKLLLGYAIFINKITDNFEYNLINGKHILSIKGQKTNLIIPKILITLLGVSGAILYIIKKSNLISHIKLI